MYSQYQLYRMRDFSAGELIEGVRSVGRELGYDSKEIRITVSGKLSDGTRFHREMTSEEDIVSLCKIGSNLLNIEYQTSNRKPKLLVVIHSGYSENELKITTHSENLRLCAIALKAFRMTFELTMLPDNEDIPEQKIVAKIVGEQEEPEPKIDKKRIISFLRKHWLTIVVTVIGITVSSFGIKTMRPIYRLSNHSVVVSEKYQDEVEVYFQNQRVQNMSHIEFVFLNRGKKSIYSDTLRDGIPMVISTYDEDIQILSFRIIEERTDVRDINVQLEENQIKISLENQDFIGKNERISLSIYFSGTDKDALLFTPNLVGYRDGIPNRTRSTLSLILFGFIQGIIMVVGVEFLSRKLKPFALSKGRLRFVLTLILFVILSCLLLVVSVLIIIWPVAGTSIDIENFLVFFR